MPQNTCAVPASTPTHGSSWTTRGRWMAPQCISVAPHLAGSWPALLASLTAPHPPGTVSSTPLTTWCSMSVLTDAWTGHALLSSLPRALRSSLVRGDERVNVFLSSRICFCYTTAVLFSYIYYVLSGKKEKKVLLCIFFIAHICSTICIQIFVMLCFVIHCNNFVLAVTATIVTCVIYSSRSKFSFAGYFYSYITAVHGFEMYTIKLIKKENIWHTSIQKLQISTVYEFLYSYYFISQTRHLELKINANCLLQTTVLLVVV